MAMSHGMEGTVMPWPVANSAFEDVDFLDGTGWLECAGIHRAIKERAECVVSVLASTTYADDFSGDVWIGDPAGDHIYLRDLFEQWYTDIETLVDNSPSIKWTTESAGTTEWTMATLEADIAMGAFADLLTDSPWPTDPRPFIWLQKCLDRLIHVRRFKSVVTSAARVSKSDFNKPTASDAWDAAKAATEGVFPVSNTDPKVGGTVFVSFGGASYDATIYNRFQDANIATDTFTGTQTGAEWELRPSNFANCTLTEIDLYIDGAGVRTIPFEGATFVPVSVGAIPMGSARSDIFMRIDTVPPSLPFDGTSGALTGLGSFGVQLYAAWVYFDIAAELTDQ